ncbi:MAG: DUF1254 domain-containing protein, partial [Mycobacterium sp.]
MSDRMDGRVSPDGQRWLRAALGAGAVAAGVGAALVAGAGPASADTAAGQSDEPQTSAGSHRSAHRNGEQTTARSVRSRPVASAAGLAKKVVAQSMTTGNHASVPDLVDAVTTTETPAAPILAADQTAPSAPAASATAQVPDVGLNWPMGPIRAAITAAQAFIYGYPLMEYERVRAEAPGLNMLMNLTSFANPDVDPIWKAIGGGKRPNTDTFYSLAELDLTNGPVVLSIPDMGTRYFSFQLTDPYTNVSGYIGSRTTGSGPGTYAITWAEGPQVEVPGATVVEVPYASMMMLGRTLAGNEADQQTAIALIRKYTLTPTGATGSNDAVLPANCSGIAYLNGISDAMTKNPPPAQDAAELAKLARIGVGVGRQVSDANLGPLSLLAADLAVKFTAAVLPALAQLTQFFSAVQNHGWAIPNANIGNYGTDYLLRAGVAEVGLVANTQDEAMYEAGILDSWYLPLTSLLPRTTYTLHFDAGQLPPAEAFWSVTVYDSSGNLVPNALGHFSVSSSRP